MLCMGDLGRGGIAGPKPHQPFHLNSQKTSRHSYPTLVGLRTSINLLHSTPQNSTPRVRLKHQIFSELRLVLTSSKQLVEHVVVALAYKLAWHVFVSLIRNMVGPSRSVETFDPWHKFWHAKQG
jgi:hypothetical protein